MYLQDTQLNGRFFGFSENEPAIRELTRYYTSYTVFQNPKCQFHSLFHARYFVYMGTLYLLAFSATRMLAQTLSNLVTANEDLLNRLWDSYLSLPEEQLVLM